MLVSTLYFFLIFIFFDSAGDGNDGDDENDLYNEEWRWW